MACELKWYFFMNFSRHKRHLHVYQELYKTWKNYIKLGRSTQTETIHPKRFPETVFDLLRTRKPSSLPVCSAQRVPKPDPLPDPTQFSFENHRIAGNPKYRVLPEISGNTRSFGYYPKFRVLPDVSGCKLFVNYPEYPELPGNTRNTRNYPRVKKIPENTRLYFSTLLPDPNPTRYPVFFPIPDPTRY